MRLIKTDSLFVISTICSVTFGVSQFIGLLSSIKGINLSWLLLWQCFMTLNVSLAWGAYRFAAKQPSGLQSFLKLRLTKQVLFGYCLGFVLNGSNLTLLILQGATFKAVDITTLMIVIAGLAIVVPIFRNALLAPMARGWYAVFSKAVPQVLLAVSFWQVGGDAMPLITLAAGHGIIITRLLPIILSYREQRDDHTRGLLLSEGTNEASWLLVTLAWYTT